MKYSFSLALSFNLVLLWTRFIEYTLLIETVFVFRFV